MYNIIMMCSGRKERQQKQKWGKSGIGDILLLLLYSAIIIIIITTIM